MAKVAVFCFQNGVVKDLGVLLNDLTSSASAINSSGQIVGNSGNHAELYSNGTWERLSIPGSFEFGSRD